ncbi:MAG: transcriptional regulator [Terracidiphilus sp.]|nr:transcriptional regulator [Terracidiphilus sp.]
MISTPPVVSFQQLWSELWISLASLLRSYTAVHGLSSNRQATVELDEKRIMARSGTNWLELRREGSQVSWHREDGRSGDLELTEAGRLLGSSGEVEMDMAAEAWARELMQ